MIGEESGFEKGHKHVFDVPRIVDYKASVHDIANYLMDLMQDKDLRRKMGDAGRKRAVEHFDYRVVAKKFLKIINDRLGIN
jgi:glycosyltransferase involved in cell wall biosynthesis